MHSGGGGGGGGHTSITYNNYYNNGTGGGEGAYVAPQPVAAAPAGVAAAPGAPQVDPYQQNPQNQPQNPPPQSQPQQNNQAPPNFDYPVKDQDLKAFSEDLYNRDSNNAWPHTSLNLQGQKSDNSISDDAPDRYIPLISLILMTHSMLLLFLLK